MSSAGRPIDVCSTLVYSSHSTRAFSATTSFSSLPVKVLQKDNMLQLWSYVALIVAVLVLSTCPQSDGHRVSDCSCRVSEAALHCGQSSWLYGKGCVEGELYICAGQAGSPAEKFNDCTHACVGGRVEKTDSCWTTHTSTHTHTHTTHTHSVIHTSHTPVSCPIGVGHAEWRKASRSYWEKQTTIPTSLHLPHLAYSLWTLHDIGFWIDCCDFMLDIN